MVLSRCVKRVLPTTSHPASTGLLRSKPRQSPQYQVQYSFSSNTGLKFTPSMDAVPSTRSMSTIATVKSLDHLVLTVSNLEATTTWYEKYLGMKHTSFSTGGVERHALSFGAQKINIHVRGKEFEPKAEHVQTGSGDLCFLIEEDVEKVCEALLKEEREGKVSVLEGGKVVDRTGARGQLRSVYVRDPDGNLIELSNLVTER